MIIKATRTGRKVYGVKVDPHQSTVTVSGVKLKLTEYDSWSSGEHAGDGEYIRTHFLETQQPVDPWPNIKVSKMVGIAVPGENK